MCSVFSNCRALHLILRWWFISISDKCFAHIMKDVTIYKSIEYTASSNFFVLEIVEEILKWLPTRYNEHLCSLLLETCSETFCLITAKLKYSIRLVLMLERRIVFFKYPLICLSVSFSSSWNNWEWWNNPRWVLTNITVYKMSTKSMDVHYIYFVSTYVFYIRFYRPRIYFWIVTQH